MKRYDDREVETAKSNIEQSIQSGLIETVRLHGITYADHKDIVDAIVAAVYRKLTFRPKLWSLHAVAQRGLEEARNEHDKTIDQDRDG